MKILLIGGGGREHALAWKLASSPDVDTLLCAPGNPGMAALGECIGVAADDADGQCALAERLQPDLLVIGPEAPMAAGLADRLTAKGMRVFGPTAGAARIESSKSFAKDVMTRHGVPTARHGCFTSGKEARAFLRDLSAPYVLKADGLAGGKGVVILDDLAEAGREIDAMLAGRFGAASSRLLIEEFMPGVEVSFFALSDGSTAMPLGSAQDYKRAYEDDKGPNTGGMGALSPSSRVTADMEERIMSGIVEPILAALAEMGTPFRGVLYAGLMVGDDGSVRVVECNARFGDPECQALMVRLESDLLPYLLACADGDLSALPRPLMSFDPSVCVVMAATGYPQRPELGALLNGLTINAAATTAGNIDNVHVFHAGTALRDGALVSAGGRVLSVSATGKTLNASLATAYEAVAGIKNNNPGLYYRSDIGRGITSLLDLRNGLSCRSARPMHGLLGQ